MSCFQQLSKTIVELWNNWEIRVMVLLSLTLQVILIIFGSRRKYIASTWLWMLVWSSYLLADMVATVALGNLARSQGDEDSSAKDNNLIQKFWAPFLLLHLGGPDTITAYSIQDNELWLRHLLGLLVQVGVASYVFIRSWDSSNLTFLAIPMFIAGIIKYGERTYTLKSSTTNDIKDILRKVRPQEREYELAKEIIVVPRGKPPTGNKLHQAYYLFRMSIFLFEDLILGYSEFRDSYEIVSKSTSEDAFKLIEIELGLIYDLFYTKAVTAYSNAGIVLRSISFLSSLTALVVFAIVIDKRAYPIIDVDITYVLLGGAVALEVYAIFYLMFSDWIMILYLTDEKAPTNSISKAIHSYLIDGKRWSGSIGQYNLISSCRKINPPKLFKSFGLDDMLKHMHIEWRDIDCHMKGLIFDQLSLKGRDIMDKLHETNFRRTVVDQRGDGVLEKKKKNLAEKMQNLADKRDEESLTFKSEEESLTFMTTIIELEFNHSLLIWHIATDLCYYDELRSKCANNLPLKCKIAKYVSDYMFYLLVMRTSMLPKGIGDIDARYQEAREEVRQLFKNENWLSYCEGYACVELLKIDLKELEKLIGTQARVFSSKACSKYKLVDGCKLARNLQSLASVDKWEMISEVWIEMLAFAATHCEWKEHAQQLRRGGELLTHVCLLMAHLGLSQHYQEASFDEVSQA